MKLMNERINLEEIERKMYREANSDGIMELLLGILLFFMAAQLTRPSWAGTRSGRKCRPGRRLTDGLTMAYPCEGVNDVEISEGSQKAP